jgi:hypothetical protein
MIERPGLDTSHEQDTAVFYAASRPVTNRCTGAFALREKHPELEADHIQLMPMVKVTADTR